MPISMTTLINKKIKKKLKLAEKLEHFVHVASMLTVKEKLTHCNEVLTYIVSCQRWGFLIRTLAQSTGFYQAG